MQRDKRRELREILSNNLGIKKSRIYDQAKAIARRFGEDTWMGLCVLAAQNGVQVKKYLTPEDLKRVQELLLRADSSGVVSPIGTTRRGKPVVRQMEISVGKKLTVDDPLLKPSVIAEAKQMAEEVYPLLYVFENSVRELVSRVMTNGYGSDWWNHVPQGIRDEVNRRKEKEDKNPWHGKRGAHEIFYTDLEMLGNIVQTHWKYFKQILPSAQWLIQRLADVAHSRNPVAHMNPLHKDDIEAVKVACRQWHKQIAAKKHLIPSP